MPSSETSCECREGRPIESDYGRAIERHRHDNVTFDNFMWTLEPTRGGKQLSEPRKDKAEYRFPSDGQDPMPALSHSQENEKRMSNSRQEIIEDPLAEFPRLTSKLHSLWLAWTYPFGSIGKGVSVHYTCDLSRSRAKYIRIGDRVILGREVWLNIPNVSICNESAIILEDGCGIGRRSVISAKNQIHIQRNTIFGPSVLVMDHNHAFEDVSVPIAKQPMTPGGTIRIEEGCWIGFGAVIVCSRGELVIGRNSVVGANSVVSRSVPAYSVVTGNPAKIVKQYDIEKNIWVVGSSGTRSPRHQDRTDLIGNGEDKH
jgi:acetyltransferase-like isoleucine patch superfamily enzyme